MANIFDTKATQGASGLKSHTSTDFLTCSAASTTLRSISISTPSLTLTTTSRFGSKRDTRKDCAAMGSGIHFTTIDKTASERGSQRLIIA
ncbi:hypothetical protein Lal_00010888 [Lupinus albus]|nr:hypothetical protein Lal_00010888 [Lupinus albus]